ncbi:tetratricopeptide repeat (TPR)-like superfamily protein [Artemisia annua]|uniref:Tetratricopeptide repeat (TPR)-like superfamily protein n=1 Tax=Artemisia annua TaxID=35608 RepID=A0A2U1KLF7_ARTAN|nr:tetratricopeptide repeat (TPR)-like superfamily protein [Artemisia annua]
MSIFASTATTIRNQLSAPPHDQNDNLSIPAKPHSIFTRRKTPDESSFCALSVSSWTSSIAHYCRTGRLDQAAAEFTRMRVSGAEPNHVTYVTLLPSCADFPSHALSFGASVHGLKGHYEHALEWFQEMQESGVQPDFVTIVSALSACANLGALGLGLWLHRIVLEGNMLRDNVRINNSLIDMYCRCGSTEFAVQVFHSMSKRNLVSWNSVIVGFALNGNPQEALKYFYSMQKDGVKPDGVTFKGALTACSHAGLVDEGSKLFDMMLKDYRISPRIKHYGCLVDLYSRASLLEEALNVIESMPMKPNEVVLGSVLGACRVAVDIRLAEKLMRFISKLNPSSDSNFVLLSNIYAAGGDWHKASNVRRRMKNRGIEKNPGISSIEIDGIVYQFVAGDQSHLMRGNNTSEQQDLFANSSQISSISGPSLFDNVKPVPYYPNSTIRGISNPTS